MLSGVSFGGGQFSMFLNFAVVFYFGAVFFKDVPFMERGDMFKSVFSLIFAGYGTGLAAQALPDLGSARNSAGYFFHLMQRKDEQQEDAEVVERFGQ